jgi:hypothetical protein
MSRSLVCSIFIAALLVAVSAHRSQAELVVTNGNFQNLTGLTALGGVWYGGVPTGWTGVNASFTVRELDPAPSGNYAANLNALTTTTPFQALYQGVGTLPSTSIISLSFELIPLISPTSMSAGIFNTNSSSDYADWTALALPAGPFATAGFHTLATSVPISANTPIGIAFWQGGSSGAPAIDNVAVVPEPSAYALIALGAAGLGSRLIRRRPDRSHGRP